MKKFKFIIIAIIVLLIIAFSLKLIGFLVYKLAIPLIIALLVYGAYKYFTKD